MRAQTKTVAFRMVLVLGLAAATTAALLYWIGARAPEVSASTRDAATPAPGYGDVGVTWAGTDPVTTTVGQNEYKVWAIATYHMTVTFYVNSVNGSAVFTFTPESDQPIDGSLTTSHFFRFEGRYDWGGLVSLNDVKIELQYDPAELNGAREHTLHLYHYDIFNDMWEIQNRDSFIDLEANLLTCKTNETGIFGLGGYQNLTLLPVVMRSHN